MKQEVKELEQGLMWWECDHEAKGFAGCPLCDDKISDDARVYLKQAKAKIIRCQDAIRSLLQEHKVEEELPLVEIKEKEPITHQVYGDYYDWL